MCTRTIGMKNTIILLFFEYLYDFIQTTVIANPRASTWNENLDAAQLVRSLFRQGLKWVHVHSVLCKVL